MQTAQRPFVFTNAEMGNQWLTDSEHDMAITILMRNISGYPAISLVSSQPQVWMGTTTGASDVIRHCQVDYPIGGPTSTIAPLSPNIVRPDALGTVRTGYIYDYLSELDKQTK